VTIPKYLAEKPTRRGQKSEHKFGKKWGQLRRHPNSGATIWNKDDFSVSGRTRIEMKAVCRGTQQHTINLAKLSKFAQRAEQNGEVPLYVIVFEGAGTWIMLPEKYLKGVTNGYEEIR